MHGLAMLMFVMLAAVVVACGGSSGSATSTSTSTTASTTAATATATAMDAGGVEAELTEEECAAMADHMLDVQLEERKKAGEEMPEPGQIDETRRGIKADFVPPCVEQLTREVYECWMQAGSRQEFESCAGGEPPPSE
jgi:hypothetical protein